MCDIKPNICMTSHDSIWHHTHSYKITILYSWLHIHSIHDSTPTLYDITYSILAISQPLYLDKTPPMFMTSYSVCMTSHMVYAWWYNHGIWHHTHCVCVISSTWLMISQTMYVWNHTHCMLDTIGTIYDITSSLDDIIQFSVCHGTH